MEIRTTIAVDDDVASRVRHVLRALVRDLAAAVEDPAHGDVPGLPEAVAEVLAAVRELDAALPGFGDHHVDEPPCLRALVRTTSACSMPIRMPIDAARRLVVIAMDHCIALDRLLAEVLRDAPDGSVRPTKRIFAWVIGCIYVDLVRPLHRQHPELEPLALGGGGKPSRE